MIEVQDVSKSYGALPALQHASLTINPGEIVALWGPSGCGKTTALRCIAGLERPDTGAIQLRGEIVSDKATWREPHLRRIGFVFQELALWPHLRVRDHILYPLKNARLPRAERETAVKNLCEQCHLTGYERAHPNALSGGERQRVAWARALASNADIILLDEAFAYLDESLVGVFSTIVQKKAAQGATVLIASHQRDIVEQLATRIVPIQDGALKSTNSKGLG